MPTMRRGLHLLPYLAFACLLGAVLLAIYWPAHAYPFLSDDVFQFGTNPTVHSWHGLAHAWTTNYWEGNGESGLYRPLLKMLWTVEVARLGGSKTVIIALNLLLHLLNALLIVVIGRKAGLSRLFTMGAALLFACHPANTEVLVNGVGQGELLTLLFGLSALALVFPEIRSINTSHINAKPPNWRLAAFVLLLSLNLLIKEQAYMAMGIGCAALWLNAAFSRRQKITATVLCAAAVIGATCLRWAVLGTLGPQGKYQLAANLIAPQRLVLVLYTIGHYVQLALVPTHLSNDYSDLQSHLPLAWSEPFVWLGLVALISVILLLRLAIHKPQASSLKPTPQAFLLLLLMACLPLAPFLNLRPIGTLFGERLLYHALAGICLLLAYALQQTADRARSPRVFRRVLAGLLVFWAAALGWKTATEARLWRSGLLFWGTMLQRQPESFLAASNLAYYQLAAAHFSQARALAIRALQGMKDMPYALLTLGEADLADPVFKRPAEAKRAYARAAEQPEFYWRGRMGMAMADVYLGQIAQARAEYEAMAREKPENFSLAPLAQLLQMAKAYQASTAPVGKL